MAVVFGRVGNSVSAIALAAMLSACASRAPVEPQFLASPGRTSAPTTASTPTDPNERMNRAVFENNQEINHSVIYPVAKSYRDSVPEPVRDSIDAFTSNIGEPFIFANNVLQLRFPAAATTLGRFIVNSTFGIGGLIDVATPEGMTRQTGDFGQTLYVWGVRDSEYLVLPVVGPTNTRDAIGNGFELAAQLFMGSVLPTSAATAANHMGAAGTVASPIASLSKVDQMQQLETSSLDFYTMLRSVVEQKRQAELRAALRESPLSSIPGLEDSSGPEAATPLVSPALMSPALQSPALESPTLQSPALESPAISSPALVAPPTPAERPKKQASDRAPTGRSLTIERPNAGG